MKRLEAVSRISPRLAATACLALAAALAGCGPSGPATEVNQPVGTSSNTTAETGPAPASKKAKKTADAKKKP